MPGTRCGGLGAPYNPRLLSAEMRKLLLKELTDFSRRYKLVYGNYITNIDRWERSDGLNDQSCLGRISYLKLGSFKVRQMESILRAHASVNGVPRHVKESLKRLQSFFVAIKRMARVRGGVFNID